MQSTRGQNSFQQDLGGVWNYWEALMGLFELDGVGLSPVQGLAAFAASGNDLDTSIYQ